MGSTRMLYSMLILLGASLGALLFFLRVRTSPPDLVSAKAHSDGQSPDSNLPTLLATSEAPDSEEVPRTRSSTSRAALDSVKPHIHDNGEEMHDAVEDDLVDFRAAVEATLVGRLDLDSILNVAERIANLEVDARAYPEPHPVGRLQFPIPEAPEGLTATFAVARSRKFAEVLTLAITMDQPSEPYLLEGAVRDSPTIEITSWFDDSGEPMHFGILTAIEPNRVTRSYGLSLDQGEITEGVSFHIDLADPSGWKATPFGLRDGMPAEFHHYVGIGQDPTSRIEQFRALSKQLLHQRRALDR